MDETPPCEFQFSVKRLLLATACLAVAAAGAAAFPQTTNCLGADITQQRISLVVACAAIGAAAGVLRRSWQVGVAVAFGLHFLFGNPELWDRWFWQR